MFPGRRKTKGRYTFQWPIEQHYTPLHPDIYEERTIREACKTTHLIKPFNLKKGQILVEEPVKGVYVFPFLEEEFCARLWEEIHHYEKTATKHPKWCLPLFVRHDGNIGDLQVCGFKTILKVFADASEVILQQYLNARDSMDEDRDEIDKQKHINFYHAFLTRNYVGRESNATFKMHRDKSDLTLNICIHASHSFEGSTVGFYHRNKAETGGSGRVTGKQQEQEQRSDETPQDDDRIYTYVHKVGFAVAHSGKSWHRTDPITNGTRGSLIAWAELN